MKAVSFIVQVHFHSVPVISDRKQRGSRRTIDSSNGPIMTSFPRQILRLPVRNRMFLRGRNESAVPRSVAVDHASVQSLALAPPFRFAQGVLGQEVLGRPEDAM